MSDSYAAARTALERHFGFTDFRPAQAPVIRSILSGRDTLAVLPTGGGKSICFQVPALLSTGVTLVVSPLISLMQDQVRGAARRGIPAAALHSALSAQETAAVLADVAAGRIRLLYTSPERLPRAVADVVMQGSTIARLAVDEAHCISEWGHDFRPEFRAIGRIRKTLGWPQTIAFTGSATPGVRADIVEVLHLGRTGVARGAADIHLASFDRPNLWFGVHRVRSEAARLAALLAELVRGETSIVYAPTRKSTESLTLALRNAGHHARPYHAGLDAETRAKILDDFLADKFGVVVATSAFGMGIDKPGVRRVVHWTMPPTPEAYYQEAGRAGRDGAPARCTLLLRRGDASLHRRQLDVTFPPRRMLEGLWRGTQDPRRVAPAIRESAERLRAELRPERGPVDWRRITRRRATTDARIGSMEHYASTWRCRRRNLLGYFGERLAHCSGCDRCRRG
ncbi:MAG: RecQ family ATP-dependent DNA helicase [Gemmatimonadota bacterium]